MCVHLVELVGLWNVGGDKNGMSTPCGAKPVPQEECRHGENSRTISRKVLTFDKGRWGLSHFHESLIFPALLFTMSGLPLPTNGYRAVSSFQTPAEAKSYNRTKLLTAVFSSILSFLLLLLVVISGYSRTLADEVQSRTSSETVALLAFVMTLALLNGILTLPLSFYSGYLVEHRYQLSNQTFWRWGVEQLKVVAVGAPIGIVVLLVLYYCIKVFDTTWWLPVGIVMASLHVVAARLAPILIFPLFYESTPIQEGDLKERISRIAADAGMRVEGIFSFNLSKNTRKANAVFAGIGQAKRILLGDTLIRNFSDAEIETVFAHEVGHYRLHHIRASILTGVITTFLGLFVTAHLHSWSLDRLGIGTLTDLAGLPLLAVWLSLFSLVTSPITQSLSRRHEREADAYAVQVTNNAPAFVSALHKLSAMNLADPAPHPLVEMLFYSHPPMAKRVQLLESSGG
jgi:STE24 endopeptidase